MDEDLIAQFKCQLLNTSHSREMAPLIISQDINHCYMIDVTPAINFELSGLTSVRDSNGLRYEFKGFLILSMTNLDHVPPLLLNQHNLEYTISLKPHPLPTLVIHLQEIMVFMEYLFVNLLNLSDWFRNLQCHHRSFIQFMPMFTRPGNDGECLSSFEDVLRYFLSITRPFTSTKPSSLTEEIKLSRYYTNSLFYNKSQLTYPVLRVDRINWKSHKEPFIIHFNTLKNEDDHETNKEYKEKELKCMALYDESIQGGKLNRKDHFKLKQLRHELREIKKSHRMIKEETIEVNCQGYLATSIFTDVVQRALICPLITSHILFHSSLPQLQHSLNYQFSNKTLLEQALTHSSYLLKHSISSSPITLTAASRCGRRLPVSMATHEAPPTKKPKSGIEGLLDVTQEGDMPGFESDNILQKNNERLEFLGDAVIEFICSMRLYDMFPVLTDGQLVLFRKALICNQNLTTVAKRINLRQYLLTEQYPEEIMSLLPSSNDDGSDRYDNCLANTMEAVIGAIYLDGGLKHCHNVLASLLFPDNDLCQVWLRVYKDPLKRENPDGDRHMVDSIELLKSFTSLEESIGVTFSNIRLLARAFTHPSYGYTSLMLGDYQRMEFLGDAILQLVTSTYVYQSFPLHNEGHLSAFRTAIVCNKQLSLVSLELGFNNYIILGKDQKNDITDKILADVVESFISALYLDKGIEYVETFCRVCLFPKLAQSAEGLQFLDAKTRLQHAIVYTCKREGNEIEVPIYKVLNIEGPVNKQIFTVGVYFRGKRLAVGTGSNSQKAGMEAAEKSLASGHIRLPSSLRIRKNV